jgi:hypothetical protein
MMTACALLDAEQGVMKPLGEAQETALEGLITMIETIQEHAIDEGDSWSARSRSLCGSPLRRCCT